jgi:hypothetical protein
MDLADLRARVEAGCRRALIEQDRDPHSPTFGCFDRRYWAWKLVDYPEATFQRNVLPLLWLLREPPAPHAELRDGVCEAVAAGLRFAARVQHPDGSFDQAFPHEHSFGATAFLLHPLVEAARALGAIGALEPAASDGAARMLRRAAEHLCRHDETHGTITNHIAGAVLSLHAASDYLGEPRYARRADDLLGRVLATRSPEGWFPEYDGADPGYQSLCVYYLALVLARRPSDALADALTEALAGAVRFLSWFVHPDGSFAGTYGSRRTGIFYPGGVAARAACGDEVAQRISEVMLASVAAGRTPSVAEIDVGNLAPLLSNYVAALDALACVPDPTERSAPLPFECEDARGDFPAAGLFVRRTRAHYVVVGASNGGVVSVFDVERRAPVLLDGGYVAEEEGGRLLTTQGTGCATVGVVDAGRIALRAPFVAMRHAVPTPGRFLLLRLANLTLMRSVAVGNVVKAMLVRLLVRGGEEVSLVLERTVHVGGESVVIEDELRSDRPMRLRRLERGRPFVAIHMASARYFEGFPTMGRSRAAVPVDPSPLSRGAPVSTTSRVDA